MTPLKKILEMSRAWKSAGLRRILGEHGSRMSGTKRRNMADYGRIVVVQIQCFLGLVEERVGQWFEAEQSKW